MAILCSAGGAGWLMSSQIEWTLNKLYSILKKVLNTCSSVTTAEAVRTMARKYGNDLESYNFIINVEENGMVVWSHSRSGNYWVLVSVDLESRAAKVYYCDSSGWDHLTDLENYLASFIAGFRTHGDPRFVVMHVPTKVESHMCNVRCKHYPLQRCSNVCGIVAVISAAISTLVLFSLLCGQ
ncbi:hypothetical protein ElyMa_004656400 [Elysia marginata]|uniref:Uncharacterized protein n=1 Tax=Elysia marginata TaxID=1093978 RepID=A0AAV4I5U9_9GAST|nr:hypothetical protein ElyMa_004656400 [Elysia marginata]